MNLPASGNLQCICSIALIMGKFYNQDVWLPWLHAHCAIVIGINRLHLICCVKIFFIHLLLQLSELFFLRALISHSHSFKDGCQLIAKWRSALRLTDLTLTRPIKVKTETVEQNSGFVTACHYTMATPTFENADNALICMASPNRFCTQSFVHNFQPGS